MPRPNAREYIAALFAPLVKAADDPSWATELKTKEIPVARKRSQYERLAKIHEPAGPPLSLPPVSYVYRFAHNEGIYTCIDTENLSTDILASLTEWAETNELLEVDLDESALLFLAYKIPRFFRPKGQFLTRDAAENVLNIIGEQYNGHPIDDVMKWYRDVRVFTIQNDNVFASCKNYRIAASLCSKIEGLRSSVITRELANKIGKLVDLPNVNPENLYYALTSTHWKQIVLELYKCLEAAFYLPWVKRLRAELDYDRGSLSLAKICKTNLRWREKEEASILELFGLLPVEVILSDQVKSINAFSDLQGEKCTVKAFARRVYKIRNQLVHQFDYEDPVLLEFSDDDWPVVAEYICETVEKIYTLYAADIDYTFEYSG